MNVLDGKRSTAVRWWWMLAGGLAAAVEDEDGNRLSSSHPPRWSLKTPFSPSPRSLFSKSLLNRKSNSKLFLLLGLAWMGFLSLQWFLLSASSFQNFNSQRERPGLNTWEWEGCEVSGGSNQKFWNWKREKKIQLKTIFFSFVEDKELFSRKQELSGNQSIPKTGCHCYNFETFPKILCLIVIGIGCCLILTQSGTARAIQNWNAFVLFTRISPVSLCCVCR